jgi:hypothetical protein
LTKWQSIRDSQNKNKISRAVGVAQ